MAENAQPRPMEIGAKIPLNVGDLQQAVALWVKQTYGIDINPHGVQFDYEYDPLEETSSIKGAHYDLDRKALRDLLNKEAAGLVAPDPEDSTEQAARYACELENRGDVFLNADERAWIERRRKFKGRAV